MIDSHSRRPIILDLYLASEFVRSMRNVYESLVNKILGSLKAKQTRLNWKTMKLHPAPFSQKDLSLQ